MPTDKDTTGAYTDDFIVRLVRQKQVARDYQIRRHENWNDNYSLYRNKVKLNRLTQRQSVNIPLMKETIKTLLSKIDDPPTINWKEKEGNKEKELVLQEKWNTDFETLNFEGIDIQDKKTVLLNGRGFKMLNFYDKKFAIDALDIHDIVVDPLMNPFDIETARYVVHQNIFRSLRDVLADPRYDAGAKKKLTTYLGSDEALIISDTNKEALKDKQKRLEDMGVTSEDFESFAAGDILLNLTSQYCHLWDKTKKEFVRYVVIYANDTIKLLKAPLKQLLGVEFYPFVTWGEDMETQDIWSDGPADLVRTPNKILNAWFSQMVENRTLKNFQMHWYDSTNDKYTPQTYEPGPGRMLPAPGDPNKTIKPVGISGLEDTLKQIEFLIQLVEKGTATTPMEKGVAEKRQITLGEVKMLVGKSMEKTLSMAKFYRRSWKELAMKWYRLNEANTGDGERTTLYKISSRGKMWPKEVYGKDWKSKAGYEAIAQSSSEQEEEKAQGIQKLFFIKNQFPNNKALARVVQDRTLELVNLTPEERREILEEERKVEEAAPETGQGAEQPASPQAAELQKSTQELQQLTTT